MKTLLLGFLLIPTLLGCDTRPVAVDVSAEFPITIYPDLIYVPVTIGGSEHLCVVDSGATDYVFHTTLRQQLGESVGHTQISSVDGPLAPAELFKVPDARIGAVTLNKHTPALCSDLSAIREGTGRDVDGFIGLPLFRSYIVQLDFDVHRIVICSPSLSPNATWGEPINLAYNEAKQPTVLVEFGDGISEQCIVDTGFSGSPWLSSKLYATLLNKGRVFTSGEALLITLTGQHRTVHAGTAPYMKIGSIVNNDVSLRDGGAHSRIGLAFLRRFRVTIDVPHDRLYLAKGAEFDNPAKQNAVGIGLIRKNEKTLVISVEPDSPANDAGISIDDELVTIAGESIAGRPLEEIKWMLREKAGPSGKLKLIFRRGDTERKVEVTIREPRGNKEQAAAIAEVQRLGGNVTFDEDAPAKPVYAVDFIETQIGDDALRTVAGLRELKVLQLAHTQVTDAGLKHMEGMTQLRTLNLRDTRVTDAGLEHVKALVHLEDLNLEHTRVTDAGLEHVKRLVHLEFLNLDNTQVTDAGLKQIGGLAELHSLSLDDTRVTDEGLKHLKVLTHLERLYTIRTKATSAGWKELKQALPNLRGIGNDIDDIPR